MPKLSVLMTVYNEADFVDYAIQSCLPYVDHLVIVEGAYKETIRLGNSERSTDGTCEIIEKYRNDPKVHIIYANELSDKDQRNIGLNKIKDLNSDGYVVIIDGDEVYEPNTFVLIKKYTIPGLINNNKKIKYFASRTFVNDFKHFTWQQFPRLFKIEKNCKFINDNQMWYSDKENPIWIDRNHLDIGSDKIKYFHYSFCKGKRFLLKKEWWESRFGSNYNNTGKKFEYDWYMNDSGEIYSPNHKIYNYLGNHPKIVENHPFFLKEKSNDKA